MSSATVSTTQSQPSPAKNDSVASPQRSTVLFVILLAVLTVGAYYPAHHDPFVNYDDDIYVTDNPHVNHGLSWDAVKWSMTTYHAFNWHPLTWVAHELDAQIFGLNPAGHHDVNVFLHLIDVVLLFWVLQRATGYAGRSVVVAALLALHPMNVESVAWVAELKTMLSMLFFLLALGAYRWYARDPGAGRYVVIAGLFALGLMAKPQVVTLPAVFLLWDYWPLRRMFASEPEAAVGTSVADTMPPRKFWWLVWEKVPLGAMIAVSSFITMKAQKVGRPFNWGYSVGTRGANAVVAYARYIGKAIWPSKLALMYPHPATSLSGRQVAFASLLLLSITAIVAFNWRRRYLVVGWLWFLGTMVPMVGIVQVGKQAMADRYAYLPFIGLFIMVCWSVAEWAERRRMPAFLLPCAAALVLLAMGIVTRHQLGHWRDNVDLWLHTMQVTANNYVAEYHVGDALKRKGHTVESLQWYYRALAINPNDAYSHVAIAFYEHENGINLPDALENYKAAVDRVDDETKVQLLTNMGHLYEKLGDPQNAHESFEASAKLRAQLKP